MSTVQSCWLRQKIEVCFFAKAFLACYCWSWNWFVGKGSLIGNKFHSFFEWKCGQKMFFWVKNCRNSRHFNCLLVPCVSWGFLSIWITSKPLHTSQNFLRPQDSKFSLCLICIDLVKATWKMVLFLMKLAETPPNFSIYGCYSTNQ